MKLTGKRKQTIEFRAQIKNVKKFNLKIHPKSSPICLRMVNRQPWVLRGRLVEKVKLHNYTQMFKIQLNKPLGIIVATPRYYYIPQHLNFQILILSIDKYEMLDMKFCASPWTQNPKLYISSKFWPSLIKNKVWSIWKKQFYIKGNLVSTKHKLN